MKIVILDRITIGEDLDISIFNQLGDVEVYDNIKDTDIAKAIKNAEVVITNKKLLNKSNLEEANHLKLICLFSTGYNNIDIDYCNEREITVCNVKGYSTDSVAQHTISLLLYLYEKMAYYDQYVKSGEYTNSVIFTHLQHSFHELTGKVWGIIGMGDIGRKVAEIVKAFGCQVQYYSTSGLNNSQNYLQVDLDTLLQTSDIISIHAPLNEKTKNLITFNEMKKMKNGAVLVNVGRGGIINETDLVEALNQNIIAGAGLDVLSIEPMIQNHPLLSIKDSTKLIITPHIAWASIEARERLVKEVYQNIEFFIQNKTRNIVSKK